jgi:dihydrofolate synthase/folylpolyglutamate synthase
MQKLKYGPLVDQAKTAELWLDGGHNAACGQVTAAALAALPKRPTYLICGMLNTKDVSGFLSPFAGQTEHLYAVSIPGEANTLSAEDTTKAARASGIAADPAASVSAALQAILDRDATARVLICGSLYLAGRILQENG